MANKMMPLTPGLIETGIRMRQVEIKLGNENKNFGMFYLTLHVLIVTSHISWLQRSLYK